MARNLPIGAILDAAATDRGAEELGDELRVATTTITAARRLLRFGTPEQISAVRGGFAPLGPTARTLPQVPRGERKPAKTAKSEQRHQRASILGSIYSDVRKAVDLLAGLPSTPDVVDAIKMYRRDNHGPLLLKEASAKLAEVANGIAG